MPRAIDPETGTFIGADGLPAFFVYKGVRVSDMDRDALVVALTDALLDQDRLRAEIARRSRETMDAAFARAGFPLTQPTAKT